jgi:hypothetical protein
MGSSPRATRPEPRGYFLPEDAGRGLLPWSVAEERLAGARNYWVATVSPEGVPHAMPVWGVWIDGRFLFSTGPTTRKARNIDANPDVVVHLERGAEVVVIEGAARDVSLDEERVKRFLEAYNPKYAWDFTADAFRAGGLYEVVPRKAFAWLGDQGEAFSGTGTRWTFDD